MVVGSMLTHNICLWFGFCGVFHVDHLLQLVLVPLVNGVCVCVCACVCVVWMDVCVCVYVCQQHRNSCIQEIIKLGWKVLKQSTPSHLEILKATLLSKLDHIARGMDHPLSNLNKAPHDRTWYNNPQSQ